MPWLRAATHRRGGTNVLGGVIMFKHADRKDGDTEFAKGTGVASAEMPQRRCFRRTRLKAAFAVKIALAP